MKKPPRHQRGGFLCWALSAGAWRNVASVQLVAFEVSKPDAPARVGGGVDGITEAV